MPPKDAASQGTPGGGGGDRFGGLKDDTLVRVLSHLKAWEAVRTCVLSKRWRNLWVSAATHLDIRQPCLCAGAGPGLSAVPLQAREKVFGAFVKNLLLRRPPLVLMDSLRLCWSHETEHGDANTWVGYAVRHGAVEIVLSGKHHRVYPSPEYTRFIDDDRTAVMIRLETLKLIHIRLDDTTLTQLCSRCARLKELDLNDCLIPYKTKIQPTLLERLTMIRCKILKGLSVNAPKLASLEFSRNFGWVPWIQNLGLLAASNINLWAPHNYPEYPGLGSWNLKILKLSLVKLDDTTLAQLCSVCTSLQELELKDCLVVGKEIRSTSLRCLTMINCEFSIGSAVHAPKLLSLCCTRPFRQVPQFRNMEFLVTAIIALDDSCMLCHRQWTRREAGKDESDHDGDFFEHFGAVDSDDDSDNESNQDEEDESDHDGDFFAHPEHSDDNSDNESNKDEEDKSDHGGTHSSAEESDNNGNESYAENNDDESYLNDNIFAHTDAEISDDNHSCSGPSDEVDGRTVGYDEIAEEYNGGCGGMFGGDGILCSLSNVRTMDLSAHSGEVLFVRESKSCTDFKNLKTLSLGEWCITPDLDVLASILRHSPKLEILFVHLDMANKSRVGFNQSASSFSCTNLKKVEIHCCKHDKMVHILAKFFCANCVAREKIFVCRTACTCDDKRDTGSQGKRKAQTEAEKKPAKQMKSGY